LFYEEADTEAVTTETAVREVLEETTTGKKMSQIITTFLYYFGIFGPIQNITSVCACPLKVILRKTL